jgi:LacI family transcriptional regulator
MTRQIPSSPAHNIRQLAAQLGVSRTTVSLALRNSPVVAPATQERIIRAARQAGYHPNVLVSALMTQVRRKKVRFRGEIIAFLTGYKTENHWKQMPSLVGGLASAQERANQLGLRLDPFWMGEGGRNSRQLARILYSRGVRGSILAPLPDGVTSLDLNWDRHPVVAWGFSFLGKDLTRVTHSNFDGMSIAYAKLRTFGHRRIGMVLQKDQDESQNHHWLSGFLTSKYLLGGGNLTPLILNDPYDTKKFYNWFDKQKPDAVISVFPNRSLDWMTQRGIDVPGDVSYVNLDVDDSTQGRMAGINQGFVTIGEMAVELLVGKLLRNDFGIPKVPSVTLVKGHWVDGSTVRDRTQSKI